MPTSNIERDVPYFTPEQIQAQLTKNAATLPQQEQLAKEKAPTGGGYVCLTRKQGNENWDFVLATKSSHEADNWWDGQTGSARVWRVKSNGETLIRSAK